MNDLELIAQCIEGDADAWNSFVDKHSANTRAVITEIVELIPNVIGVPLDPDQLTIEVFSSLLEDDQRRLRRVGAEANIPAWLAMIARRLTLKRTRVSKRYRKMSGEMEAAQLEDVPLRASIREEIVELPARDQLVLELFFFEGLSAGEISAQVGVEKSHLKKFLTAALERFLSHLTARH
ncbi:MAG: sigma-70 family RNA polymerase sigma factor [Planctomycetota bacterium]|nr:sigma-70 family RNA polymerase sigma factor [Planctomycetota bacterium]